MDDDDIIMETSKLNESIIDMFNRLKVEYTSKEWLATTESALVLAVNDTWQQCEKLTIYFLYFIKPTNFLDQIPPGKTMHDVLQVLNKLLSLIMKKCTATEKFKLINILMTFIEYYMKETAINTGYENSITTKFNIQNITDFHQKKSKEEMIIIQFHMKSLICLVFSMHTTYCLPFYQSPGNHALNVLIKHIEKLALLKYDFYSSYTCKKLYSLFTGGKIYANTNSNLVRDYILFCITNIEQSEIMKAIISNSCSYYKITVINARWYDILMKNHTCSYPYALSSLKYVNEERSKYFNDAKSEFSSASLFINTLYQDSFNNYFSLKILNNALEVLLEEYSLNDPDNHMLNSFIISVIYSAYLLKEIEDHQNTEREEEANIEKIKLFHDVLRTSKSKMIQKFLIYSHTVSYEDIYEEIKSTYNPNILLCMMMLLMNLFKKPNNVDLLDLAKKCNMDIVYQCLDEMTKKTYYNLYFFSYILTTSHLYEKLPQNALFHESLDFEDFVTKYIEFSMYQSMFMMKQNQPIQNIIQDMLDTQKKAMLNYILLPTYKKDLIKINYLVYQLTFMEHFIRYQAGSFHLTYCTYCGKKLNKRGLFLSKYFYKCSKCAYQNFVLIIEEDYIKQYRSNYSLIKEDHLLADQIKTFISYLIIMLDEEHIGTMSYNYRFHAIAEIMEFVKIIRMYCKEIWTPQLKERINQSQQWIVDMNIIKKYTTYELRSYFKWHKKATSYNLH